MAHTFFWRCEGTSLDATHDFSAGDTSAAATGSPSISATNPKVGSNCVLCPDMGEYYTFTSTSIMGNSAGAFAFWFRPETWTAGGVIFQGIDTVSGSRYVRAQMIGTDELRLAIREPDVGPSVNLDTTSANLTTGNYYFVVCAWDDSANDRYIAVYNSSLTLVQEVEDTSTAYDAPISAFNEITVGDRETAGGAFRIDNIFVGTAYTDKTAFVTNANIASYTNYGGGGGGGTYIPKRLGLLGVG